MKRLNLNIDKTLAENSNILASSQQAIKAYVDEKRIFIDFLQEDTPTTFSTGDKWLKPSTHKIYTATSNSTWDSGVDLQVGQIYSFDNLLYHWDGSNLLIYSTESITEQRAGLEIKKWVGTQDQYDAILTKDANTEYIITDAYEDYDLILATQTEFNNSVTNKAATPYQVNQKFGNYLPLAGGNLDAGAILRLTNTNNEVTPLAYNTSGYLTVGSKLYVDSETNTNSLVVRSGNIYKTSTSGDTAVWSSTLDNYIDKTTADQEITAQKILRNNLVANAIYILSGINSWSWYRALAYANSRVIVGNTSNVGLQLQTNESNIKANINGTDTNVITALDTMTGATGSVAGTVGLVPAPAATDNIKFLRGDGTWAAAGGGGSADIDNSSITLNDSDEIQAVGLVEQRANTTIKEWVGTKSQYDSIVTKDANTKYIITDDEGTGIVVDSVLSTTSSNPVQNSTITNALNSLTIAKTRMVGEVVSSTIALTDAGLHELDGSVILGTGVYADFVSYMAGLYNVDPESWTQPTLSANGTLGGNSFAVACSSALADGVTAYLAFDGTNANNLDCWHSALESNSWIEFYNPTPIKVTKLTITNRTGDASVWAIEGGTIYGSNDNSSWTSLATFTNTSTGDADVWEISLSSNNNYYKYYKLIANNSETYVAIGKLDITAVIINIPSYFTTETDWQQSIANYGVCGKYVYNSNDNTVRLPKLYADGKYLIKSYNSGTAWYRIYSDGWCEQGNSRESMNSDTTKAIDLLVPFVDTNYSVFNIALASGTTGNARSNTMLSANKTTSGFTLVQDTYTDQGGIWEAQGYVDISSYNVIPLYQYVVVATQTNTDVEVDINEIIADLNGKVNTSDLERIQCVVETYHNSTFWYRIYSDGWCEQGGQGSFGTSRASVTLLKPYLNTNYTVTLGTQYTASASTTSAVDNKTTTGFEIIQGNNANLCTWWEAKGYIIDPE